MSTSINANRLYVFATVRHWGPAQVVNMVRGVFSNDWLYDIEFVDTQYGVASAYGANLQPYTPDDTDEHCVQPT